MEKTTNSPFTQFFQNVEYFLWLLGQTVLTQLFQLATGDTEQSHWKQVGKQTATCTTKTKQHWVESGQLVFTIMWWFTHFC